MIAFKAFHPAVARVWPRDDFSDQPLAREDASIMPLTVTLHEMNAMQTTKMQPQGFLSPLSKLDMRYGWQG